MRFYFVLYLIWILLAIFSSFCCLLSLVVGWYLLVWLVLKVRLTLFWSMIHLVFVLLYLTKAVFSVYLVLHHLVGLYFNVLIFLSLRFLKIVLDDSSFFRWCIHLYISLFSVCLSIRPFIHPVVRSAQYLKNRTSANHYFWYTCVKWWYLQFICFFFCFFWNFDFLGCRGGKKAKNSPKWQKKKLKTKNNNYMCRVSYLRNSIAYDQYFLYTCVKWWYLQVFFSSLVACCVSYLRNHTSYDFHLWYSCLKR